jgi:hypothetical protein
MNKDEALRSIIKHRDCTPGVRENIFSCAGCPLRAEPGIPNMSDCQVHLHLDRNFVNFNASFGKAAYKLALAMYMENHTKADVIDLLL